MNFEYACCNAGCCLQKLIRSFRQLPDPFAGGIIHCIGDSRRYTYQGDFANAFVINFAIC